MICSTRASRTAAGLIVVVMLLGTRSAVWADAAPIKRLDEPTRAKVLAAVAGLVILGFAAVLLTWLGARVTQRYRKGSSYFRPTSRPGEHEWAKKPLVPGEPQPRDGPPTPDS